MNSLDNYRWYSLAYMDDWRDVKDITQGNTFHDSLKETISEFPSGQCVLSMYGSVASIGTNLCFIPEAYIYHDDPEDEEGE